MEEKMAEVLGIDPENVSVKATTTEKLGLRAGRSISAYAVVLLERF
jgi:2-C-methyl-D-erythritol 2,4-cyclodiphosphate synthase